MENLSPVSTDAELDADGFALSSDEKWWKDRAVFLESKGYRLRPRFLPGWTPSWKTRSLDPYLCEDGVIHHVSSKGRI